ALIVIRTRPVAQITLDGKELGPSPLELRVEGGPHEVMARASGYTDDTVQLNVALGDRRSIDLDMKKTPGIASRWWFWTAIGVVVLGGVATAVVLTREKQPESGTFSPGKVPSP